LGDYTKTQTRITKETTHQPTITNYENITPDRFLRVLLFLYYLSTIYERYYLNKSNTVNEIGGIMTFISLPGFWSGLCCGAICIHKQT